MLSAESLSQIDREVSKYPSGCQLSAVMAALRIAQEEKGWLSSDLIEYVAKYLKISAISALEVATFYNMYNLKPTGCNKLTICTNLPCSLRGSTKIATYLKHKLGISFGETTPDGKFTLVEGECFGACQEAPVILHNNHKMMCRMEKEKLDEWLEELSR
ncbi:MULTISPECIES: NADH-quinone oxidoreductase subunit NuoE [Candidatus Ichthyocystis]|uniref:NADH-quinone oxidoreductase subunit E n=1 Tax=Candidatus Ichthyocystis hellenicum TaxID=1561003 RepID=A0A0S4M3I5_9BURK|nr:MULTISPECIES: NADH-quinone oxidoreductase subunit NuoE [Ichthyocystis]CUT17851.1 NADH-quinone oxidoreductase subunit E [Candidatus Ichthyocystis hellenicum]